MSSGWDIYYVVFLSAVLALGLPLFLAIVSKLISRSSQRQEKLPSEQLMKKTARNVSFMGKRINTRFFLAVNAALVLMTLALILIPCIGMIQSGGDRAQVARGLVSIVSIAGFAAVGLLYSARKGDLSWLKSYREASSACGADLKDN